MPSEFKQKSSVIHIKSELDDEFKQKLKQFWSNFKTGENAGGLNILKGLKDQYKGVSGPGIGTAMNLINSAKRYQFFFSLLFSGKSSLDIPTLIKEILHSRDLENLDFVLNPEIKEYLSKKLGKDDIQTKIKTLLKLYESNQITVILEKIFDSLKLDLVIRNNILGKVTKTVALSLNAIQLSVPQAAPIEKKEAPPPTEPATIVSKTTTPPFKVTKTVFLSLKAIPVPTPQAAPIEKIQVQSPTEPATIVSETTIPPFEEKEYDYESESDGDLAALCFQRQKLESEFEKSPVDTNLIANQLDFASKISSYPENILNYSASPQPDYLETLINRKFQEAWQLFQSGEIETSINILIIFSNTYYFNEKMEDEISQAIICFRFLKQHFSHKPNQLQAPSLSMIKQSSIEKELPIDNNLSLNELNAAVEKDSYHVSIFNHPLFLPQSDFEPLIKCQLLEAWKLFESDKKQEAIDKLKTFFETYGFNEEMRNKIHHAIVCFEFLKKHFSIEPRISHTCSPTIELPTRGSDLNINAQEFIPLTSSEDSPSSPKLLYLQPTFKAKDLPPQSFWNRKLKLQDSPSPTKSSASMQQP